MANDQANTVGWNIDNSYARLPRKFFSNVNPTPVPKPELVVLNHSLAESLGLSINALRGDEGIAILAGNKIPEGAIPIAQAYAGHQFGHFTMLGDGRAILLGEQISPLKERFDIQLKGPGRTPYSRRGDGRAGIGPMLREYIISKGMYGLNIPTTQSLAVVTTGEKIYRETIQPGAVLTRVAKSHIRVGTFEYAANMHNIEAVKVLADYTIERHYKEAKSAENPYIYLLKEVIKAQADLISKWQLVGFIHGVMNTDNMTISGETIDYGPCAFMDDYNPKTVFSSIDRQGRYAYVNQPHIGAWNLARFAETLLPLLHENNEKAIEIAQHEILNFTNLYENNWINGMRKKLGLFNVEEEDKQLVEGLLSIMHKYKADFTNTFRALTIDRLEGLELFKSQDFNDWLGHWNSRLERQEESREKVFELMRKSNPSVIPRNHRVEEALEAAVNKQDYGVMERLVNIISKPYAYTKEQEEYTNLPPLSCNPYKTYCGT